MIAFRKIAILGLLIALFVPHHSRPASYSRGIWQDPSKDLFDYNFKIKNLEGKEVDFNDFKGKVIFLNLWATWCGPCRSEMPKIESLYKEMDSSKIAFVMLSLDEIPFAQKVKSYVTSKGFTFPVYMKLADLPLQLDVPSIPTTFIIDKNGSIVLKEVGMKNYNTQKFRKYLERLSDKN